MRWESRKILIKYSSKEKNKILHAQATYKGLRVG